MGSRVQPYFILTAEKVANPREEHKLGLQWAQDELLQSITTPAPPPSGASSKVNGRSSFGKFPVLVVKRPKINRKVKYSISVKEVSKTRSMNKRMEVIKEKLDKSRERFNENKLRQSDPDFICEPRDASKADQCMNNDKHPPFKLDRSVSDMGPGLLVKPRKDDQGNNPFVYFVVSDEQIDNANLLVEDGGDNLVSKSADKRRRVRLVEENRRKRELLTQSAKIRGLAREVGLKTDPNTSSRSPEDQRENNSSKNMPVINEIVFSGPEYETRKPSSRSRRKTRLRSPPKIPPVSPVTTSPTPYSDIMREDSKLDPDDMVPRKPFLSGPMYTGKAKGLHSVSVGSFELPTISADQKRRALGLGTRFEEFGYPSVKTQPEQKRKVSFADQLPVIRGSGFVLNGADIKDGDFGNKPSLGGRSHTLGSITLPSEQTDRQTKCQKYLAGENMSVIRPNRRAGIPLPLSKIDIVSNVYDEMIIKMIQEYLQDSNTPTRQSQLAKDLLINLQKHNKHMKELNVPNLDKNRQSVKQKKEELLKYRMTTQKLANDLFSQAPPNTAEAFEHKPMTPVLEDVPKVELEGHDGDQEPGNLGPQDSPKTEPDIRSVPFVEITFKSRNGDNFMKTPTDTDMLNLPSTADKPRSGGDRRTASRPILAPVTPVSFQMAPPGLSKDDTFVSMSLKA
ncbi:uncharacterized protein LOC128209339 [Mya arenaria]|nr:uncharacterized protein LOC128209339 [Mya arenaria]